MSYTALKSLHILSMVLLIGTGLGSAFYKWMAGRSGNVQHIAITNRHVVLADWLFTTPTVILQPVSGLWMAAMAGWSWHSPRLATSLALYGLAGLCWLPVVGLQLKMRRLAEEAASAGAPLPPAYWRLARCWLWLGVPAFLTMAVVVVLMVFKHLPRVGS
ncbi:MAG: DUF2269 domain-containing protein [Pseudacidovorax sp.]|nr:DUF2269 domain-containing protein [Pseudacidovorax sp.]